MHSSNPLIVTYNGQADLWNCKPPLAIWLNALSMRLFGVSEFAVRLPSALAALGTTFAVFRFTKRTSDRRTAILAALILIGMAGYVEVHVARSADYDSLLVLFTTLTTFSLYFALDSGRFYPAAAYGFLAFLTKGTAGALLAPGYLLYALIYRKSLRRAIVPSLAVLGGVFLFLAAREASQPGYLQAAIGEEVLRFGIPADGASAPEFTFYIWRLFWPWQTFVVDPTRSVTYIIGAFPWSLLAFLSLIRPTRAALYLWCCTLPFILLLSIAGTQHPWYVAPAYPMIAVLAAVGIQKAVETSGLKWIQPFAGIMAMACVVLNLWRLQSPYRSEVLWRESGQAALIRALPGSERVMVRPDATWRTPAVKDGKIVGTELYFGAVEFYRRQRSSGSVRILCSAAPFVADNGAAAAASCDAPGRRPTRPIIYRVRDSRIVAIP